MKQTVQNKIDDLKKMAKRDVSINSVKVSSRNVSDNLSLSIRNKREADIFRKELSNAFKSSRKA